jgi:glycosyl-4,4'-diaponeurosporenoate acyltransferase
MLVWNIAFVIGWHLVLFFCCLWAPNSTFDASKSRYAPRAWERGGRWYRDTLKIQIWKDRLPQHVGKGFSKRHFTDNSVEYLDEFIMETCRGEWMHLKDCLCAIVVLIVDPIVVGLLMTLLILIANVPFAAVQRYNRFRLQVLRKKRIRELSSAKMEQNTVTA